MRHPFRRSLAAASAALTLVALPSASADRAAETREEEFGKNIVLTDGHLRPGHLETIWVRGFPGPGRTEATFSPSAICEDECGAFGIDGGQTDRKGSARFRVRVPNGFINSRRKFTPFRNRERIDLEVLWYGRDEEEFDVGSADPRPVIVRVHRDR
jgi:hypothetical protein